MKLTEVAKTIIAEDRGDLLQKCITELERDKDALRDVDHNSEDYDLMAVGNRKLASERDQLNLHCKSLQAEVAQVRFDAGKHIADLEAKVKSAKTRNIEIAADGDKNLRDFESELVQKLEGLREMYADKVPTIGGLCSPMSMEEPSVEDYLN
jgi:SMC interacting uncharacterized protein involved in chromosome segregation